MKATSLIAQIFFLVLTGSVEAKQLIISGPMPGYTELRTTRIWAGLQSTVTRASITYWQEDKGRNTGKTTFFKGSLGNEFQTITFTLTGLEPGTRYKYEIVATDAKRITEKREGKFRTQLLWQYRQPAPDFSFLTGSCAYFNEPQYDRPGTPYGGDSSIFATMAKQPADFMLWLGDNWYTREADYNSSWGLRYRAHRDRSLEVLQPLLKAMPHYAIWDDHDFGPNDFGASYLYKSESRRVFMDYWCNPSYGQDGNGVYSQFNYSDVAFFLLDDRTWRSNDALKDSLDGSPDPDKQMFGKQQMRWLKDALLSQRNAPFKIIATGSQVLNPLSPYDCFRHFGNEFTELMDFIAKYNIDGVIFLTGDRHHSEIIRTDRTNNYPLYDITASPLTSHVYAPGGVEKNMPERVPGTSVNKQNYARISVAGPNGARVLKVQFLDIAGVQQASWEVSEKDLKKPGQ